MDPVELLRKPVVEAQAWFEATLADVTGEQAHWRPPGVANPIGAVYAHVILGTDVTLHARLQETTPLIAGPWRDRSGLSALGAPGDWHDWALELRTDLDQFRGYAQAVLASWRGYLARLHVSDLDRVIDLSSIGMGTRTLADVLGMQIEHFSGHTGEISCLKGLQGSVGYRAGTEDGIG